MAFICTWFSANELLLHPLASGPKRQLSIVMHQDESGSDFAKNLLRKYRGRHRIHPKCMRIQEGSPLGAYEGRIDVGLRQSEKV